MNQLSTLSSETIIFTLIVFLLITSIIEMKYHFLRKLTNSEKLSIGILSVLLSLFSFLFKQSYISGTGIYVRNGYPIAYVQSGEWDFIKLGVSVLFYFFCTYIIFFLIKSITKARGWTK